MIVIRCIILLLMISISTSGQVSVAELENSSLIKSPFDLRDPFKIPKIEPRIFGQSKKNMIEMGILDNSPQVFGLRLDSIYLKGVVRNNFKKKAIFSSRQGLITTYILSEGSKISNGKVTLKAILPKGVVFVEKIINVYGQPEYLETVVPISE